MNFIKRVFDNEMEESVHLQFQKFSKGEFRDRAIIKARQSKGKFTIVTTFEFANEMVRTVAEKLGEMKINVTGAVISTNDLAGQLNFKNKKQFQGVKKYIINADMSGKEITELLNNFPKAFFALSFKARDSILKIKPKYPKSSKPKNNDAKPTPDFCRLVTTDKNLGSSFIFERPEFKTAEIVHHFIIEELILPENEKDYSKIRELAKRKGRIIREAIIDGENIKSEKEFVA